MKKVLMSDHKAYVKLKKEYDVLQKERASLIPEELWRRARAAEVSVDLEAEALLDPKKAAAVERAKQDAQALKDTAKNAERRIMVLAAAMSKLLPDLQKAEEKAAEKVIAAIKPEHKKVAVKIVDLQRQLNAALEEEQGICQFLRSEVGSDIAVVPIYRLMGYRNKWGRVQPGREDDQNSMFCQIIARLREHGYKV
ncbi:MAG: hypothetical protein GX881_08030 [Firmicutes bacterium]|nr:hypothetical protein [Bacillota bacterium]